MVRTLLSLATVVLLAVTNRAVILKCLPSAKQKLEHSSWLQEEEHLVLAWTMVLFWIAWTTIAILASSTNPSVHRIVMDTISMRQTEKSLRSTTLSTTKSDNG